MVSPAALDDAVGRLVPGRAAGGRDCLWGRRGWGSAGGRNGLSEALGLAPEGKTGGKAGKMVSFGFVRLPTRC